MYYVEKGALIAAPLPLETKTYKPVENGQLIDLTLNALVGSGFELAEEVYTMTADGQVSNGRYIIKNVADDQMALQVGWQNSYNKSLALKFAIGTKIFICSNGCVSGDFGAFRKKHTGTVQHFTPSAITEYIKSAGDVFRNMQIERDVMRQTEINTRATAELVGRMFIEEAIIASTQLNIIKGQIANPSFDYGASGSLWELYQHTTYALKEVHPTQWLTSHIKAHKFFKSELSEAYQ
jgi:hypothetical protein